LGETNLFVFVVSERALYAQVVRVRKGLQVTAFLVPAIAILALTAPGLTANAAVALFVVALLFQSLGQAGFVANMSDIAPKHAGQLFGLCNTFGSFSGIVGVSAAGFLLQMTSSFDALFHLTGMMYLCGAAVYACFAETRELFV
jgi:nitrate/nitrite transporter NarK